MKFLVTTPYIKKIVEKFCAAYLIFKRNNLLQASRTYLSFSKSGTFGHPAVKIRVKSSVAEPHHFYMWLWLRLQVKIWIRLRLLPSRIAWSNF
jgi:hypothetical protein